MSVQVVVAVVEVIQAVIARRKCMSRIIKVFDTEIEVKDNLCSTNCNNYVICDPKIHLYIKVTDRCNANCAFCGNSSSKDFGDIDIGKLKYVIGYLEEKNILHGVSITGGEPMLDFKKLNNIVNAVFEAALETELSISTNGYGFKNVVNLDRIEDIESIHLSRHHYQDEVNNCIFGAPSATLADIQYVLGKLRDYRTLVLNCLLMKEYIGNLSEVKRYLDGASDVGVYKAGFVSLMKINDYCNANYIDFNTIFNDFDSRMLKGHHFKDYDICECQNGIYVASSGQMIEYYARMVNDLNPPYVRQLVYTSNNNLTTGFNGKKLY